MSSSYDLTSSVLLNTAIIEKVERYTIKDADFNGFLTFVDGLSLGEAPYIEGKDWTPKLSFLDEAAVPKPGMPVPLTVMFNDFDETMHKEDHNTDVIALALGDTPFFSRGLALIRKLPTPCQHPL